MPPTRVAKARSRAIPSRSPAATPPPPPDCLFLRRHMLREGLAWVGVSGQKPGIDGGGLVPGMPLKQANATRYASQSGSRCRWQPRMEAHISARPTSSWRARASRSTSTAPPSTAENACAGVRRSANACGRETPAGRPPSCAPRTSAGVRLWSRRSGRRRHGVRSLQGPSGSLASSSAGSARRSLRRWMGRRDHRVCQARRIGQAQCLGRIAECLT